MATLQKNVASQNITFVMVTTTTGAGLTGATIVASITKDNGTLTTGSGTMSEKGLGQYNYAPTQAETNAVDVGFLFTTANGVPANLDFHTDQVDSNSFVKVDVEAINGNTNSTAALSKTTNAVARGTCTAGATTTSVPTSALTFAGGAASGVVADQMKNRVMLFDGDTTTAGLRDAAVTISANTASNTPTFTVTTMPATPSSGDTFSVI